MQFIKQVAVMAAAAGLATGAFADEEQNTFEEGGLYVSGFVGGAFPRSLDSTLPLQAINDEGFPIGLVAVDGEIDISTSVFVGGAVGYRFDRRFFGYFQPRVEAEVSYFQFEPDLFIPDPSSITDPDVTAVLDPVTGMPLAGPINLDGADDIDSLLLLTTGLVDFRVSDHQRIVPYVGTGLGALVALGNGGSSFVLSPTVGMTFHMNKRIELYGESRYYVPFDDGENLDGFLAAVGLRYRF